MVLIRFKRRGDRESIRIIKMNFIDIAITRDKRNSSHHVAIYFPWRMPDCRRLANGQHPSRWIFNDYVGQTTCHWPHYAAIRAILPRTRGFAASCKYPPVHEDVRKRITSMEPVPIDTGKMLYGYFPLSRIFDFYLRFIKEILFSLTIEYFTFRWEINKNQTLISIIK